MLRDVLLPGAAESVQGRQRAGKSAVQGGMGVSRACGAQGRSEVDGAGPADGAAAGGLLQLVSPLLWGIKLPTAGNVGDVFNAAGWAQYALGVGGVMALGQLMLRDRNDT